MLVSAEDRRTTNYADSFIGATLRAHPYIGYANLDLLANVVAKRTHCAGERKDSEGKIVRVDREGVEEALDLLDQVGQ